MAIPICIQPGTDGSSVISLCFADESQQNPPAFLSHLTEENSITHNRIEVSFNNDFQKNHQETPVPSVQYNYNNPSFTPSVLFLQSGEGLSLGLNHSDKDENRIVFLPNNTVTNSLWANYNSNQIQSKQSTYQPLEYGVLRDEKYENISGSENNDIHRNINNEKDVPTTNSVKQIVSYIKYILTKVYGSEFREQINSIEVKFRDECHRNSFLELFLQPLQNKSVQQNEVILKKKRPVPNVRRKVKMFTRLTGKGLKIITKKKVVLEKTPKLDMYNKALSKKISYFFPKLMTKIASKSDRLVKKTLINKQSHFIVCCTAKLAWKFKNIDAFALFKLSAVEIERDNLSQAFIYYKQARSSLSEMIIHDKIFSFLFNGKTESTIITEVPHSEAKYFMYRQTKIALMNDNTIFSFAFDETDHTKLNSTEIDGAEVIKSIKDSSLEDLEKVATRFTSNSNEENKK